MLAAVVMHPILKSGSDILAQIVSFGPALLINLCFFGLTSGILWLCLPQHIGKAGDRASELTLAGLLSFLFVGALSLLLAVTGLFSPVLFFALWACSLVLLGLYSWRRRRVQQALAEWRAAQPLSVWFWLVVVVWFALYSRPFEMITGGRDPGVYVNIGAQIVQRGTIAAPDPFFASLAPAIQRGFVWCGGGSCVPSLAPFRFPGFFWIGGPDGALGSNPGLVLPQFMPFYPALMAPSYVLAGYNGALTILPLGLLLFALLIGETVQFIGREAFGWDEHQKWVTALPALFLLFSPVMVWFGRLANADVFLGLFTFAALFFWAQAGKQGRVAPAGSAHAAVYWLLAQASLGAAMLTKIDSWLLLPAILVALQIYHLDGRATYARLCWILWIGICLCYLVVADGLVYPYILYTLRGEGIDLPATSLFALLVAAAYLLAITLAAAIPPLLAPERLERLWIQWHLPASGPRVLIAGSFVIVPLAVGVVVPRYHIPVSSFALLQDYAPLPALALALIGIILTLSRGARYRWAVPLLIALVVNWLYTSRILDGHEFPWAMRRTTSIVFPTLLLFAGIGTVAVVHWLRSHPGRQSRVQLYLLGGLLVVIFLPLGVEDLPFFLHDEAQGAREQLGRFASMFPSNAVLLSDGSTWANQFGPALSANGTREVLNYYPSNDVPAFDPSTIDIVGNKAMAEGRPFFFITERDTPPPTDHWQFEDYWRDSWVTKQMTGTSGIETMTTGNLSVPYRVYRALGPIVDGKRPDPRLAIYEAEALPSIVGQMEADPAADNGWAKMVSPKISSVNASGALVYGPYKELSSGSYIARFRVRTTGESAAAPDQLTVTAHDPHHPEEASIIASRPITSANAAYTFLDVSFSLDRPETMEYSLWWAGLAETWIDRIEILYVDHPH